MCRLLVFLCSGSYVFVFRPKKPLQLPESLAPGSVIQEKLQIMIQSNTADSAPVGKGKRHRRCRWFNLNSCLVWRTCPQQYTFTPHKLVVLRKCCLHLHRDVTKMLAGLWDVKNHQCKQNIVKYCPCYRNMLSHCHDFYQNDNKLDLFLI